jgi:hypothetical protein
MKPKGLQTSTLLENNSQTHNAVLFKMNPESMMICSSSIPAHEPFASAVLVRTAGSLLGDYSVLRRIRRLLSGGV